MASTSFLGSDDGQFDSSLPFRGVVVCCTSIPPELRTDIANKTVELGGVHKYDLTPDCTHLIVGEYDTPKYRHVAKERPDVKPMAIGWVEAVRDLWVQDAEIDFDALEKQWQLRTFETGGGLPTQDGSEPERGRLLCCMTGFDEPNERQKIVDKIQANGGVYMGDLTKRVTHLVVYKAEGRKFQAARGWGISTVSIEWINDSIARGMILDEKCYDPILPVDQRGVGAWNKNALEERKVSLGKRLRDNSGVQEEGKRKLRKTASMKLTSQAENLWSDILGKGVSAEPQPAAAESEPAPKVKDPAASGGTKSMDTQMTRLSSFGASEDGMVFASCGFYVHGFSDDKTAVVVNAIASLGGLVCHSLDQVAGESGAQLAHRFLVVPQLSTAETHPPQPDNVHIITQFYIERCMHKKYFFDPSDHVFGRPFSVYPIPGFEKLTICTAGFTGVDLNHMDKALQQLGAKYEERFTADASVLICSSLSAVRPEKLRMAKTWKVPVVNSDWLWECISAGFNVPIREFLFAELKQNISQPKAAGSRPDGDKAKRRQDKSVRDAIDKDLLPKPAAKAKPRREMDNFGFSPMLLGGSDSSGSGKPPAADRRAPPANESTTTHFETAPTHQLPTESNSTGSSSTSSGNKSAVSAPLSETSANALNRTSQSPQKSVSSRKPLSRVVSEIADSEATDGDLGTAASTPRPVETLTHEPVNEETEAAQEENPAPPEPETEDLKVIRKRLEEKAAVAAAERLAISTKLTSSLLNSAALDTLAASAAEASADSSRSRPPPRRRKREVLGRAISNVSAGSNASDRAGEGTGSAAASFATEGAAQQASNEPPPATQIQYEDPAANVAKAHLLHKIMGKRGAAPAAARSDKVTFSDLGGFDEQHHQQQYGGPLRRSKRK
ncbi:BRCT domain-containing protein [Cercophora newfieldiana]|uniref:BRCT domain-containing protein n=1 Tax=Cercophora newfieldiana TaxID=92897 RepID=A0AA39Y8I3_9PEZI|nr:BRCT domain-containing protein [Cercophora newfieldiana]